MSSTEASQRIHRLRIGDWIPSAVRSLAVQEEAQLLAVGRDCGDIEICDINQKFHTLARVAGREDFKLQSLVWAARPEHSNRLFGISLRGFIFEVNFSTLLIENIQDTFGGTAWALAASPRDEVLAVGCEDGMVRLFRYDQQRSSNSNSSNSGGSSGGGGNSGGSAGGLSGAAALFGATGPAAGSRGALEYERALPTSGDRVLCLCYHPTEPLIFVGCGDGVVRCMEERNGRVLFRMTGDVLRGSVTTLIWTVMVFPDSTVVTGDSRGQVQIWDGKTGVLMDSFRHHAADVIALAGTADGQFIFAAGVDGKVVCLQNISAETHKRDSIIDNSWVYVHSQRAHTHDVLALSICNVKTTRSKRQLKSVSFEEEEEQQQQQQQQQAEREMETTVVTEIRQMLVSGGIDAKVCFYSATQFLRTKPVWILPIPVNKVVQHAADYELILLQHRTHIDVWGTELVHEEASVSEAAGAKGSGRQVRSKKSNSNSISSDPTAAATIATPKPATVVADNMCQLRVRLQAKGSAHIHCSAVARDGSAVAFSSANGLRVYLVGQRGPDGEFIAAAAQRSKTAAVAAGGKKKTTAAKKVTKKAAAAEPDAAENLRCVPSLSSEVQIRRLQLPATEDFAQCLCFFERHDVVGLDALYTGTSLAMYYIESGTIAIFDIMIKDDGSDSVFASAAGLIQHRKQVRSQPSHADVEQSSSVVVKNGMMLKEAMEEALVKMKCTPCGTYLTGLTAAGSIFIYSVNSGRLYWRVPLGTVRASDFHLITVPLRSGRARSDSNLSTSSINSSNSSNSSNSRSSRTGKSTAAKKNTETNLLVVVSADNTFRLFDVAGLSLHQWSQQHGEKIPSYVLNLPAPLSGVGFRAASGADACPNMLVLYAQGYCVFVNLDSASFPTEPQVSADSSKNLKASLLRQDHAKKRKRAEGEGADEAAEDAPASGGDRNFVVLNKYRNLLHMGYSSSGKLVVIENPWARIMPTLPETLARKRYGT